MILEKNKLLTQPFLISKALVSTFYYCLIFRGNKVQCWKAVYISRQCQISEKDNNCVNFWCRKSQGKLNHVPTSNKTDSFSILDLFYVKIKFFNERNCSKKRSLIKIWYKIGCCSLLTSCQRWWKMSEFRAGFLQYLHKLFGDIDAITYLKPPDFTNRQILTPICGYGKEMSLHHWHIFIGRSTCI